MRISLKVLFVLLLACIVSSSKRESLSAFKLVYNQHTYDIYKVDPREHAISMFWKDSKGEKLKSLASLRKHVEGTGHQLVFATNAGMYMPDNSPQGLYIEGGKELHHIDLRSAEPGNFYMQPNGVFVVDSAGVKVLVSADFNKYEGHARFATQSGPMLVARGEINSNFKPGSANTYIRSGVGVNRYGEACFVISEQPVNFYDLAILFKDSLKCDNALYLDGAISKMYLPAMHRMDADGSFGAMIAVTQ